MILTSADQVKALPRGEAFSVRLDRDMSWADRHRVLYAVANREVTLTLFSGEKIVGRFDECPSYFARGNKGGARVWLRVAGRKTRKGVDALEIRHLKGYRAASLADALTAFIVLNANGATEGQVAEAREVVRDL